MNYVLPIARNVGGEELLANSIDVAMSVILSTIFVYLVLHVYCYLVGQGFEYYLTSFCK